MIPAVINHLWQSTLFAAFAGLLTLALRRNRAQARHWVWLAASIKFLLPFSLLVALGGQFTWRTAPAIARPAMALAIEQTTRPFVAPMPSAPAVPRASFDPTPVLAIVWACGVLAVLSNWLFRWRRVRSAIRSSQPAPLNFPVPVRSSAALIEPGIFGIFRPVLLLPTGIAGRLAPEQLRAILAHELTHVRRRDNLTAFLHMLVEAIFWFHPLVWWIGTRLVEERERACDEAVLQNGSEPEVYAEGILNICKLYVESPLACVSGVTGANLKKRIEAIMSGRIALKLNLAKIAALALAGTAALAIPILMGILNAPGIHAQPSPRPKFEVASVKPCKPADAPPAGGGRKGAGASGNDPGRLSLTCQPVERLIQTAYVRFADGKPRGFPGTLTPRQMNQPIEGIPGWATSELYTIDAKPESPQTMEMLRGPMLQTLLEDRFKLKLRRDTRDVPVYAMVVAKGGAKLQPTKGCTTPDFTNGPPPPPAPGEHVCGPFGPAADGGIVTYGQTLAGLCMQFSVALDRDVVDRTGITGQFDMHLEILEGELFPFDRRNASATDAAAPVPSDPLIAFRAAIQKLGLRLEESKAPAGFIVVEHVERPSEN
jgi:uncharacterized protein (TIGR03435 family)